MCEEFDFDAELKHVTTQIQERVEAFAEVVRQQVLLPCCKRHQLTFSGKAPELLDKRGLAVAFESPPGLLVERALRTSVGEGPGLWQLMRPITKTDIRPEEILVVDYKDGNRIECAFDGTTLLSVEGATPSQEASLQKIPPLVCGLLKTTVWRESLCYLLFAESRPWRACCSPEVWGSVQAAAREVRICVDEGGVRDTNAPLREKLSGVKWAVAK